MGELFGVGLWWVVRWTSVVRIVNRRGSVLREIALEDGMGMRIMAIDLRIHVNGQEVIVFSCVSGICA